MEIKIMTDEQRRAIPLEYLRRLDRGRRQYHHFTRIAIFQGRPHAEADASRHRSLAALNAPGRAEAEAGHWPARKEFL